MNNVKRELFRYIRGIQKKKFIILFSVPMLLYRLFRFWRIADHGKILFFINKLVLLICCVLVIAAVVLVIYNIVELIRLKSTLSKLSDSETKLLEEDFRFGTFYLDKGIVIGSRYVISKGSMRLFSLGEISGVYDDIRETQGVFRMLVSGANDVVKTKIIKAEYPNRSFIHDRRICAIEVHKNYDSSHGTSNGYDQLERIEAEIREKIMNYPKETL